MNTQNTSLANLFAKPTVADGTLHARHWTTNIHNALAANTLTVENPEAPINYQFTTEKANYTISSDVLAARALYESFQGQGIPVDELLSVMQSGFLSPAQQRAFLAVQNAQNSNLSGAKKGGVLPTARPGRILSSSEYLANCLKTAEPDLTQFYTESTNLDKLTKQQLIDIITNLRSSIVTKEQETQLASLILSEEQELLKFKTLTEIGFFDLSSSSNSIACKISMVAFADNAISKLQAAGYEVVGNFSMFDASTILLTIKEGKVTI
jgi:hypothetical protein